LFLWVVGYVPEGKPQAADGFTFTQPMTAAQAAQEVLRLRPAGWQGSIEMTAIPFLVLG